MITAKQMVPAIGQETLIHTGIAGLEVSVVVRDVKTAYGNIRLLVAPKDGRGQAWVDLTRVVRGHVSSELECV